MKVTLYVNQNTLDFRIFYFSLFVCVLKDSVDFRQDKTVILQDVCSDVS